jgi:hypothetical protein
VHGERVIVIEKPKTYHKAIRGIGAGLYPAGYPAKERKSSTDRAKTRID